MKLIKTEVSSLLESLKSSNNILKNGSYLNFKNSIFYTSNYPEFEEIKKKITDDYEEIIDGYNKVISWLNDYINDVENFENTLSSNKNTINDLGTRKYVDTILNNNNNSISKASKTNMFVMKVVKVIDTAYNNVSEDNKDSGLNLHTKKSYGRINGFNINAFNKDEPAATMEWSLDPTSPKYSNGFYENQFGKNDNSEEIDQELVNEIKVLYNQYGENAALAYIAVDSFQKQYDDLTKQKAEILSELEKLRNQSYHYRTTINRGRGLSDNQYKQLYEDALKKIEELEGQLEEIKDNIALISYYLNESKHAFELSKYTYILETEEYKKFESEYFFMMADDYYKKHGIERDTTHAMDIQYMTKDQQKIYWYYLYSDNRDLEKAEEFYNTILNDINKAKGAEAAQEWINKFEEMGYDVTADENGEYNFIERGARIIYSFEGVSIKGIKDGVKNFYTGLKNAQEWSGVLTADDYKNMIIAQYLSENTGLSGLYEFNSSLGNMIPSIAASAIVSALATPLAGKIVGTSLMSLSAAGNTVHQSLANGNDPFRTLLHSILIGFSEGSLEYFLGKMPFLSKKSISLDSPLRIMLGDLLSNGIEESLQDVVYALSAKIILNEDIDFDSLPGDMANSFLMGVVMAMFMGGASITLNTVVTVVIDGVKYQIEINDIVNELYKNQNTSLTKYEISNILKSISKNDSGYTVNEMMKFKDEYKTLVNDIDYNALNKYLDAKSKGITPNIDASLIAKFDRILVLQSKFDKAGIKYKKIILKEPGPTGLRYIAINSNSGMLNFGVFFFSDEVEEYYKNILDDPNLENLEIVDNALMNIGFNEADLDIIYADYSSKKIAKFLSEYEGVDFLNSTDSDIINQLINSKDGDLINILLKNRLYNLGYNQSDIIKLVFYTDKNTLKRILLNNNDKKISNVAKNVGNIFAGIKVAYDGSKPNNNNNKISNVAKNVGNNFAGIKVAYDGSKPNNNNNNNNNKNSDNNNEKIEVKKPNNENAKTNPNINNNVNNNNSIKPVFNNHKSNNSFNIKNPLSDDGILFDIYNAVGFAILNKKSVYSALTNFDTSKKRMPSQDTVNNYWKKLENSNVRMLVQSQNFVGIKSKSEYDPVSHGKNCFLHVNSSNYKGSATTRLYLNIDYETTFKILPEFMDECEKQGLPYYFKTAGLTNVNEIGNKFQFERDESIVFYITNDKDTYKYVNIINSIMKKHPEAQIYNPPILTGVIDGYIGYGAEPNKKGVSYNQVRSNILKNAYEETNKKINNNTTYEEMMNIYRSEITKQCKLNNVDPNTFVSNL